MLRSAPVLLALTACPKATVPVEVPSTPSGPVFADDGGDLVGANGVRATVVGTLERRRPAGAEADGTAIVLGDGAEVYVTEGSPPAGWEWLLGTAIRVQGTLWERQGEGWAVPKLLEPDAPMPADVSLAP